jgi:CarD family transcriptional regulator
VQLAGQEVGRVYQGEEARDWSRRYKANLEKLGCGDLAKVAEVVGDLELREREARLSAGE